MNYLNSIVTTNEKISKEYRNSNSIEQIKKDLLEIDFENVSNPHIFNLKSLLFPSSKTIINVTHGKEKLTGDLEIDDESHSYYVNGIPTHNTVNLPKDYSFEDFQNIYLDAYKTGYIKGLTTYRSGTMTTVLSAAEQKETAEEEEVILSDVKMPESSNAEIKVLRDYEGGSSRKWYCTIGLNENGAPISLFVQTNAMEKTIITNDTIEKLLNLAREKGVPEKFVSDVENKFQNDSNSTKIARAIGLLLRHGVRLPHIVSTLDKIEGVPFSSFIFHIKKLLSNYIKSGETVVGEKCSICNGKLIYESGCQRCINCSSSKCG